MAPTAKMRLAELNQRLVEIPKELGRLATERDAAMRGGPAGVPIVRRVDERVRELRTEAEVLETSQPSMRQAVQMEEERHARRRAAGEDIARHELLAAATRDVESALAQLARLRVVVGEAPLRRDQVPGVLVRMAELSAALRQEWEAEVARVAQKAVVGRALLRAAKGVD